MSHAGRGCFQQPPPSGDAGRIMPASASPWVDQVPGDEIPAIMHTADWRSLASLVWSTAPLPARRAESLVVLEAGEARLVIDSGGYQLPDLTSNPYAPARIEANATWG